MSDYSIQFIPVGDGVRRPRKLIATPGKPTAYGGPTVMLRYAPCDVCQQSRTTSCGFMACPLKECA